MDRLATADTDAYKEEVYFTDLFPSLYWLSYLSNYITLEITEWLNIKKNFLHRFLSFCIHAYVLITNASQPGSKFTPQSCQRVLLSWNIQVGKKSGLIQAIVLVLYVTNVKLEIHFQQAREIYRSQNLLKSLASLSQTLLSRPMHRCRAQNTK